MNQCDGCARGLQIGTDGNHYEADRFGEIIPVMACTADRYAKREEGTPRTDAIRSELRDKYPQGGILYYMEIAECYGQECAALERELTEHKALLVEALDGWQGWCDRHNDPQWDSEGEYGRLENKRIAEIRRKVEGKS